MLVEVNILKLSSYNLRYISQANSRILEYFQNYGKCKHEGKICTNKSEQCPDNFRTDFYIENKGVISIFFLISQNIFSAKLSGRLVLAYSGKKSFQKP